MNNIWLESRLRVSRLVDKLMIFSPKKTLHNGINWNGCVHSVSVSVLKAFPNMLPHSHMKWTAARWVTVCDGAVTTVNAVLSKWRLKRSRKWAAIFSLFFLLHTSDVLKYSPSTFPPSVTVQLSMNQREREREGIIDTYREKFLKKQKNEALVFTSQRVCCAWSAPTPQVNELRERPAPSRLHTEPGKINLGIHLMKSHKTELVSGPNFID